MIENRPGWWPSLWIFAYHGADQLLGQNLAALRLRSAEYLEIVLEREDVRLAFDRFAERMFAVGQDVVVDAAQREDVHRCSLDSQIKLNVLLEFYDVKFQRTVLCPFSISGAIQPSVPVTPDRLEKLDLPMFSFLHSPKSDIIARTCLCTFGSDSKTFCGLISR